MRYRTKEPVVLVFTRDIYLFYGLADSWNGSASRHFN